MALVATHIKFAVDLKDELQVKDIKRYIVGTVYPDSRYVTGIDRELTHPRDFLSWRWRELDDFKKGWLVHLIVDEVQWQFTKAELPQVLAGEVIQGNDFWIRYSALKILHDLEILKQFDVTQYLPYLKLIENPNKEDLSKLQQHNEMFISMYTNQSAVDLGLSLEMWRKLGVETSLVNKMGEWVKQYLNDEEMMAVVAESYNKMLNMAQNIIRRTF